MNGTDLLVDTNIALYLLGGDATLAETLQQKTLHLSFITELELQAYPGLSESEALSVREFLADCVIFDLNAEVKALAVRLRREYRLKLPDALIAGTALYLKIPLMTADHGFQKVDELSLVLFDRC